MIAIRPLTRRLALLVVLLLGLATPPLLAASRPQAITVVMDNNYPPYVFQDSEGMLQGILIDQWRLWEEKTGIKAEITATDWGKAMSRMEAGEFDVIDTIFKSEQRASWLDFSPPYARLEVPIFFDRDISGITNAASLKGFVVAAKNGDHAVDLLKKNGVDTLQLFASYEAIIQAAKAHKVNIFVADKPPALYFLYKFGISDHFKFSPPLHVGEFHRAVAKGRHDLLQVVVEGFDQITPTERQRIDTSWSGASILDHGDLRYLFIGAAALGLLVLILFAWNHTLRQRVLRRTAELKTSEERFQAIYNSVTEAIFIHDMESGAILDVNQRMCEMYGYSREEACRTTVESLSAGTPPYSRADALSWVTKAAHGETPLFEWLAKDKGGALFWAEINMRRARIGDVDRILVSVRDISERKLAEESLRKSQHMLQHILDSVPQYIFWKDSASVYLGCNRVFAAAAGLSHPDQIVGKSDFDLPWLREESVAYRADDQEVMANNRAKLHIIEQQLQANGQRLWVDTSKVPLLDAQGQVSGVLGIYSDITERARVDAALRESESRYRLLFESAGDAIFIMRDDIILECNEKGLQLFGCADRACIVGQSVVRFSDALQVDERPVPELAMEKIHAALHGETQFFPWRHKRYDGVPFDTEVTLNGIDLGEAGNLLAIVRDVSAQKQSELQLRQAQKMESIGTLAGGIAHDFNNILNAIIGYTDLAMLRGSDEGQGLRDDLRQVRLAADRATGLVRQILTFSRKQQQTKTPVQISLIVKEALKLLRASIPTTIDIRQEITSRSTVLADPTEIHQLIMNLCTNAFQAMMERGGVLGVALKEIMIEEQIVDGGIILPPGCYCQLAVSDSGCGMEPETMAKIFEPYFTTKEVGKGTGLGLAVVHGIVTGHHGLITVHSEPGHGTTFNVYLPIIAHGSALPIAEETPPGARAHERVMVVDDELFMRDLISQSLIQAGYRVETFANGLEAWQALEQRPMEFDLLITDQTMPAMTGKQLAAKALLLRPTLPIILCSGYNALMGEEEINKSGISAFLQKPITRHILLRQCAKTLTER